MLFALTKKMNMTVVSLQPSLDISFETSVTETTTLTDDVAELLIGVVPPLPTVVYIRGLCPHRCH